MSKTEAEFKPISTDPESSQSKGFEALRMSFFMGCWQSTTSYLKEDLNSLLKSVLDTKYLCTSHGWQKHPALPMFCKGTPAQISFLQVIQWCPGTYM